GGEVRMGEAAAAPLRPGQAVAIATGGMLPPGADAVAMLEYAEELQGAALLIHRPVAPGENVLKAGEDLAVGRPVVPAGRRLGPAAIGLLAAAGFTQVQVRRRPRVAVISTGDELVPPRQVPLLGQVRDANGPALAAAVAETGGEPRLEGIVGDEPGALARALRSLLDEGWADLVLVSGGSSVGHRDETLAAIRGFPPGVLVHGVALKPGKPTILGRAGDVPVVGLPGHPVSALVVFDVFVRPLIRGMLGLTPVAPIRPQVQAILARNVPSAAGREEHVRVRLETADGRLVAHPLFGKSGALHTLAAADGVLVVPEGREGLPQGESVPVYVSPEG
ncbi:MAG: gephyrin-like molybdotransferase Glp, partial [Bacillota bacterium]